MLKVDLTTHNGNPIGNLSVANIKTDKKGNILLIKTKKPKLIKGELVGIGTAQFSSELKVKIK
jgi:hypothetical protein